MSATPVVDRPMVLAKLLALGPMPHREAVAVCGWGDHEFAEVVRAANMRGLVAWLNDGDKRLYHAGISTRRAAPTAGKKFARNGDISCQKGALRLQLLLTHPAPE